MPLPVLKTLWSTSSPEMKIILEHDCIAGAAGLVPIPLVEIPVMIGNQITLYGRLNGYLGVSLSKSTLKVIGSFMISQISGIIAVLPAAFVAKVASWAINIIFPPAKLGTAAIDALTNAAITHVLGVVYLVAMQELIKSNGNGRSPTEDEIKSKIKNIMEDDEFIREAFKDGKEKMKNVNFKDYVGKAEEAKKTGEQ